MLCDIEHFCVKRCDVCYAAIISSIVRGSIRPSLENDMEAIHVVSLEGKQSPRFCNDQSDACCVLRASERD